MESLPSVSSHRPEGCSTNITESARGLRQPPHATEAHRPHPAWEPAGNQGKLTFLLRHLSQAASALYFPQAYSLLI